MYDELHIDVESRSCADLRATGMYKYFEDPTTDLWCAAYAFDNGEVQLWIPGDPCPSEVREHIERGGTVVAQNAGFERQAFKRLLGPKYGWPVPTLEQFDCTAARCAALAIPRDLARAAVVLGLSERKDEKAARVMKQLAKPRSKPGETPVRWWDVPDKLAILYEYCKQDVRTERAIGHRVRKLDERERKIWLLDQRINERGFKIDTAAIKHARVIADKALDVLDQRLSQITGGYVTAASQGIKLCEWLTANGLPTDSVDSAHVAKFLEDKALHPTIREVLEIRKERAKSSVAKLDAFEARCSKDGRVRDNLMYAGATTLRWSGLGVQPQNFPRPEFEQEEILRAFDLFHYRDPVLIEYCVGMPMKVLASALRGMIIADDGKLLDNADLANIEGRVLAWLAGETWKLEAFRNYDAGTGPDLYKVGASRVLGKPIEDITKLERQNQGKVPELACIQENQRVLTPRGPVAIQDVRRTDLVWDGVEWVAHEGVVFRGEKEVITWDGLTATEDHVVWTEEGRTLPFGLCARQQIPLLRTGHGRTALWARCRDVPGSKMGRGARPVWSFGEVPPRQNALRVLSRGAVGEPRQSSARQVKGLSKLHAKNGRAAVATKTCCRDEVALRKPERQGLPELRGTGNPVRVLFDACVRALRHAALGAAPALATRPKRQREGLRSWEFALCFSESEQRKQKNECSHSFRHRVGGDLQPLRVEHDETTHARRSDARSDYPGSETRGERSPQELAGHSRTVTRARTYDILNAGPRNRFTVEGRLVHNCGYQGGVGAFQSIARIYKFEISDVEAEMFKRAWRRENPKIVALWERYQQAVVDAVRERRKVGVGPVAFACAGGTLWVRKPNGGFLSYIDPQVRSVTTKFRVYNDETGEFEDKVATRETVTVMTLDRVTRRWYREALYGGLIAENITQAVARDVMADGMLDAEEEGHELVLTVHDELLSEIDEARADDIPQLEDILSRDRAWFHHHITGSLPVAAEGHRGKRYGKH